MLRVVLENITIQCSRSLLHICHFISYAVQIKLTCLHINIDKIEVAVSIARPEPKGIALSQSKSCSFLDDREATSTSIGVFGWLLFGLSWCLVAVTLPFSLCVLLKVKLFSKYDISVVLYFD